MFSADGDSQSFMFLRSGESDAADSLREIKRDHERDINLKEVSNDNVDNDILSKETLHRIDFQLERSPSASNHPNLYNSELDTLDHSVRNLVEEKENKREKEEETNDPNYMKQNESDQHQKSAVNSETSILDKRFGGVDMQANQQSKSTETLVLAAQSQSSALRGNYNRPVNQVRSSAALNQQSKEQRIAFDVRNSPKYPIRNISVTDRTRNSATPEIPLQFPLNITDPNQIILSNGKNVLKGKVTKSGNVNHGTIYGEPILPTTTRPLTQEIVDNIAANMEVRFDVLEDFERAVITLRNKGPTPIERNQWSMYVCITTGMELGHLVHRPEGYILPQAKSIKLTHLNGCSYKVEPARDFKAILPGKSLEFMVHIGATLARSDLAPRWYIAAEGLEPRTISSTADENLNFVFFRTKRNSWNSFGNNDAVDFGKAPLLVIPTPSQTVSLNESMKLSIDDNWVVFGGPELVEETSFLAGTCDCLFTLRWLI